LEQLPDASVHGTLDETPVPESTLHVSEDAVYSCVNETGCSQNETNETDIKEEHGELINDVLAPPESSSSPSILKTQLSRVPEELQVENIQTEKNGRPELEPLEAETQLTICGEPFEFNTLLR
jgi:hypothetical protein